MIKNKRLLFSVYLYDLLIKYEVTQSTSTSKLSIGLFQIGEIIFIKLLHIN